MYIRDHGPSAAKTSNIDRCWYPGCDTGRPYCGLDVGLSYHPAHRVAGAVLALSPASGSLALRRKIHPFEAPCTRYARNPKWMDGLRSTLRITPGNLAPVPPLRRRLPVVPPPPLVQDAGVWSSGNRDGCFVTCSAPGLGSDLDGKEGCHLLGAGAQRGTSWGRDMTRSRDSPARSK